MAKTKGYLELRRQKQRRNRIARAAIWLCRWLVIAALLMAGGAFFAFVLINWMTGCCEPGGACVPARLYPQCDAVHQAASKEELYYGEEK